MTKSPRSVEGNRQGTFKKLLSGSAVLAFATVLTKIIGLIYKVPLVHFVGVEGMAYFLAANHIYILLFVLSTAGLPVAVSAMISKSVESGDRAAVIKIYNISLRLFLTVGLLGSAIMMVGAPQIAELIGIRQAVGCIVAISPAVLMSCISGAIRGYFQGHQKMCHTAISQIIEAIGKLFFGLMGAAYSINKGMSSDKVAAFAIFGITAGVGFSMLYLIVAKCFFDRSRKGCSVVLCINNRSILKQLIRLALPVTLSCAVLSLGGVIDTVLTPNCLSHGGFSVSEANKLYSCYGNMSIPLFSLIPSLIAPISMALVPIVSAHHSSININEEKIAICQSIKLTLLIAVPSSLGLAFFSEPILKMIFRTDGNAVNTAAVLLSMLALSIVPACLITTTNAILQAQYHAEKTILSMICGILIKLIVEYLLIRQRNINIYGAPISTLACDLTVISMNFYYVIKYSPALKNLMRDCIGIAWSALLSMGATVIIWYTAGMESFDSSVVLIAVLIASVLYFGSAWLFGIIDSTMLNMIPGFDKKFRKRTR